MSGGASTLITTDPGVEVIILFEFVLAGLTMAFGIGARSRAVGQATALSISSGTTFPACSNRVFRKLLCWEKFL
jgi:hypothetical protein